MTVAVLQVLIALVAVLAVYDVCRQSLDVFRLLRYLRRERRRRPEAAGTSLPRAAIVLSLRGPDPRLRDTLHALLAQDYPDFAVRVIVDSEHDPVLTDLTDLLETTDGDRLTVSLLRNPSRSCSLKCSSLIQAIGELDRDVEVLAFIDGDAIPHPTWLRELVRPLQDGTADVSGGNRWYVPPNAGIGTLARYLWNVPFLTGMWAQGAPWAGTMALKRETADRVGLLEAWSTAMSVDATLHRCMRQHGLRFKLVESLIMPNREDVSLPDFQRWVTRQMAVLRYSISSAVRVAQVQVGILLALHSLLPLAALMAFALGAFTTGSVAIAVLASYWLICSLRIVMVERSMRASLRRRGHQARWVSPSSVLLWYPAVIVTHYVVGLGVLMTFRLKQVDWRGISYRLSGNGFVSMAQYRPFGAEWIRPDNRSVI